MQKLHEILDKISRLIYLVSKGKQTPDTLSKKLSVSKKTIQNWISYLKANHNVIIYFDRSVNCYRCASECGKLIVEFKKDSEKKKDQDDEPKLA